MMKAGNQMETPITLSVADITIEDMIADEDMVITVTRAGYVKRSPLTLYREQARGGKGRKGKGKGKKGSKGECFDWQKHRSCRFGADCIYRHV